MRFRKTLAKRHLRPPSLSRLIQDHFLTGVLAALPFVVIAWIFSIFLGWLWTIKDLVPLELRPESLFEHHGLALLFNVLLLVAICVVVLLGISLFGWFSKRYLGKKFLDFLAELILQIPVIRSIYSALDQLFRGFNPDSQGGRQFSRVVYVEYPRHGCWALAFVTSEAKGPHAPVDHLNLFVPTTPNPTGGFHLIVPAADVRESHMTVEQAFKTILSLGIAQPTEKSG